MATIPTLIAILAFAGLALLLGLVIDDVIWGARYEAERRRDAARKEEGR